MSIVAKIAFDKIECLFKMCRKNEFDKNYPIKGDTNYDEDGRDLSSLFKITQMAQSL